MLHPHVCCHLLFQRRMRKQSGPTHRPRRRRSVAVKPRVGAVLRNVERTDDRLERREPTHRTRHRRRQPETGFRRRIHVLRGGRRQRWRGDQACRIGRPAGISSGQHVALCRQCHADAERTVNTRRRHGRPQRQW
jgi:hypothetical protein